MDRPRTRRVFLTRSLAWAGGVTAMGFGFEAGRAAVSNGWKIGCYTRPWDQFDLGTALDGIAAAGYRYAGLMTARGKSGGAVISPATPIAEAARIRQEARQRNLVILSVYGDFSAAGSRAAAGDELRRLIENCAACGSPDLLLGGVGDEKLYEAYYGAIADTCDLAASKGVRLTIKPHGGLNATGPQCRQAIARVGHPNFRLWYDPGNILYYSDGRLDPVADAGTVDGLVVGMSVKDFRPPKEVLVTPGTGRVDFPAVLARLKQGGFQSGPLIVECVERKPDAAQVTAQARQARELVEHLTGQAA